MLYLFRNKFQVKQVLSLPRYFKISILLFTDIIVCYAISWLSFFLRIEFFDVQHSNVIKLFIISVFIFLPLFFSLRVYQSLSRYFSVNFIFDIILSTLLFVIILSSILFLINPIGIPRSLSIIQPVFFMISVIFSRLFFVFLINLPSSKPRGQKIIIYGAGTLGSSVSKILLEKGTYDIVGFIDKDKQKIGRKLNNIKIYSYDKLEEIVSNHSVNSAVISIKNLTEENKSKTINHFSKLRLKTELVDVNLNINKKDISLRKININDIIEKKSFVKSDTYPEIRNKNILVSGAGGSIGSELAKQIIKSSPKLIILLDNTEYNLFKVNMELKKLISDLELKINLVTVLASVVDSKRLDNIFYEYKPVQVFHAAAYKHVALVEKNPIDSINNNVIGTANIVNCASKHNVERFLFISTDKAVNPTTFMGKSKRLGELIIKEKANLPNCKTIFSIVRFGNVLGSSGSVIPLFIEQIENGGPITLTHKDVRRYFLTIEDAVSLVLEASQFAKGGEIYLLDMGDSIKIMDLAIKLIHLSGQSLKNESNPNGEIEIKITGLDPIEKLDEELIISGPKAKTFNPSISEVDINTSNENGLLDRIEEMKSLISLGNNKNAIDAFNRFNFN